MKGTGKMRQTTFLTLFCAAFLSIALYYLEYEVNELDRELDFLNKTIVADQGAIRVLKAEWSHLNDIYRLEDLAERYLNMRPTDPSQITSAEKLAPRPMAPRPMAAGPMAAGPMAAGPGVRKAGGIR